MENSVITKNDNQEEIIPTQKKHRDSNFELLRIIAMFLIILNHLSQHGLWFSNETEPNFNYLLSRFRLGWLGNLLFMLISGYFMAKGKFSWKKLFKMWMQTFSISAIIGLITFFSKIQISSCWYDTEVYSQYGFFASAHSAGIKELIRSFLPCYFGSNWFVTAYMVFYLFAPFCSKLFDSLNEKQHRSLLFLMIIIGTVIPFFPKQGIFKGNRLFIFILCHCIGDYINRYNPKILNKTKLNIVLVLLLITFFYCFLAFSNFVLFQKIPALKNHNVENRFGAMDSPLGILCAVLIFSIFKNLSIKHNRFINTIASTTLGVYLLHENFLINRWLWHAVFKMDNWLESPLLLPYMLLCALIVFITCSIIELLRSRLFDSIGRLFNK